EDRVRSAKAERDAAVARAERAEQGAWRIKFQQAVASLLDAERARDEWKARAEKAEQAVDPIEEKAISAFKVAWHEADMHGDEGNRTRRGMRAARKVIEGG